MKKKKLTRRHFLSGAASTAVASCFPLAVGSSGGQYGRVAVSREMGSSIVVTNSGYRLVIDPKTGGIASLCSTFGAERELLAPQHARQPLFMVELMDERRRFTTLPSSRARAVQVHRKETPSETTITIEYEQIGGLDFHARATVRCPANETLTYWNLEWNNNTRLWIGHIQFPVVQIPFDDLENGDHSHLLSSASDGILAGPVAPSVAAGQWGSSPRNTPETWRENNYPGQWWSAQLMAYYNDAGGLYIACHDAAGLPKFLGPLLEDQGITMALGHYPGTCTPGAQKISYDVAMGTFQGDWYRAAEIYRSWASKQPFCARKLAERTDMPKWLAESPIAIAYPMRGQSDWDGPAMPNPEYTPATNALPYLDALAKKLEGPLIPIAFNWEHAGPWVQPDAFPPLAGEAAMREFMAQAKQRGWHPMLYGDGLSWVTGQKNTGYDGMPYFRAHHGEAAVVQDWKGELQRFDLGNWRQGYVVCVGTGTGRDMVATMTRNIAALQPAVIQQFDQGPGPVACYALDHGHPPVPGPWMTENFNRLMQADEQTGRASDAGVAFSCEGAPPEIALQKFQIWDSRTSGCPLYSFLYHEYANGFQGFYTNRVNDEALRLSVARALVTGYMLNFTLRDHGQIEYDWDQPWTRAVPDQAAILDWAKRANQFRAGVARDYLIYGRMLRPWTVSGVTQRDFGWGREPLVPSATWQSQDGRTATVLANAADLGASIRVELPGSGPKEITLYLDGEEKQQSLELPAAINLELTPRSLCMIEISA